MARSRLLPSLLLLSLPLLGVASCGSDDSKGSPAAEDAGEIMDHNETPVEADAGADMNSAAAEAVAKITMPMVKYSWDPEAGDASVSAEMGGPGFTGLGWESNMEFQAIGSADAIKGGSLKRHLPDWPPTLRMHGKHWNASLNYVVRALCYESLLGTHPITDKFIPGLATHWKISEDRTTYTYRINPAARFSDGTGVTAQDVVASWDLRMDPLCLDPSSMGTYGKMDRPVAKSKYIVEVVCNTPNWRNFLYFSGMGVFPASEVAIPGDEYLDKYQFAYTANSGPYIIKPEDIKSGESISLTRRTDWWDIENAAWTGMYNIGTYVYEIVMDDSLAFEKIKKGELDYYTVPRAQWWVEDSTAVPAVERGLLVRRKFFTDDPVGTSGIAINTQRAPLDDLRLRKALKMLYNVELFNDKLFFGEYLALESYWQGGVYQSSENVPVEYDPFGAVELLKEMGWTEINAEGIRIKDGKALSFSLAYSSKFSEPYLTIFQENARKAGINIQLQLDQGSALWKKVRAKSYDLAAMAWGAIDPPNPETSFGGHLADVNDNNNITSFKNDRVDALCKEYDEEYGIERRREIMREIDHIIYEQHPYVLGWYGPSQRMMFWNKFSMPEWGSMKQSDDTNLHYIWWVDPVKEAQLEAALANPNLTMDPGPVENRFWKHWNAAH
jgi:microcin C transport system substrate-binding protein